MSHMHLNFTIMQLESKRAESRKKNAKAIKIYYHSDIYSNSHMMSDVRTRLQFLRVLVAHIFCNAIETKMSNGSLCWSPFCFIVMTETKVKAALHTFHAKCKTTLSE